MPETLHWKEFEPIENRRKSRIQDGGLGSPPGGTEKRRYFCCNCKKEYRYTPDLDFSDFGEVIDNICGECRKALRNMRTNHPAMEG